MITTPAALIPATTITERVTHFLDALTTADANPIFLSLTPADTLREQAQQLDALPSDQRGDLHGVLIAVKDNIDVAGLPTTAACPGYSYEPASDAPVVAALRAAGALIVGKTNLDQFATGLVGTRSPYGQVWAPGRPELISGGSSSGSAAAVAAGLVDAALGTDTAGSGRVPAALNSIYGVKSSLGIVSTQGVVPACASWDVVTVFARDLATAGRVHRVMATTSTRPLTGREPCAAKPSSVIGVPDNLTAMDPTWRHAFTRSVETLRAAGVEIRTVSLDKAMTAAKLLYESGLVSERYEAVGSFMTSVEDDTAAGLDPTVATIVRGAAGYSGAEYAAAFREKERLKTLSLEDWEDVDYLLIPTAPGHPTRAAVDAEPIRVNAWMGTYTNFCNLFDMNGIALPGAPLVPSMQISEGEKSEAGHHSDAGDAHAGWDGETRAGRTEDAGAGCEEVKGTDERHGDGIHRVGVTVLGTGGTDAAVWDIATQLDAIFRAAYGAPECYGQTAAKTLGLEAQEYTAGCAAGAVAGEAPGDTAEGDGEEDSQLLPVGLPTGADLVQLVVFGLHMTGHSLAYQLHDVGARPVDLVRTAPLYRMVVVPGDADAGTPDKPGVVTVGEGGDSLLGQRWLLTTSALGTFLATLPAPMALGAIQLAGQVGEEMPTLGFLTSAEGLQPVGRDAWWEDDAASTASETLPAAHL